VSEEGERTEEKVVEVIGIKEREREKNNKRSYRRLQTRRRSCGSSGRFRRGGLRAASGAHDTCVRLAFGVRDRAREA